MSSSRGSGAEADWLPEALGEWMIEWIAGSRASDSLASRAPGMWKAGPDMS